LSRKSPKITELAVQQQAIESPRGTAAENARNLTIWRLTDGKPGHEKQTLGLAEALANLTPCSRHDLMVEGRARGLAWWLGRVFPPGHTLPAPDLILVAGHGLHAPGLAARRARGGKLVTLMRPSLPCSWFDLCLIPEHDQPDIAEHIIPTRGALNAVGATGGHHRADAGVILIGGPTEDYAWNDADILDQVRGLAEARPDIRWRLTTSRRTPPMLAPRLRAEVPANVEVIGHLDTPPGWVEDALRDAAQAWVTEDSVSMLYEALTAGCHVGLLRLPRRASGRLARGVDKLIAEGWITPMEAWRAGVCAAPPNIGFNEAARCARLILEKWFPNAL
jgi:mitochondrial fission protein ELM1